MRQEDFIRDYSDIPLNHPYFKTTSQFVNYVTKICPDIPSINEVLTVDKLLDFLWALEHETIFKRNWVKPPHSVLVDTIKRGRLSDIKFILTDYHKELNLYR